MKFELKLLIVYISLLFSCNGSEEVLYSNYLERQPTFYHLRHGNWLSDKWIRDPKNLLTIHETFKKVGYSEIISSMLSDKPLILQDIYINKLGYDLVDSLITTYSDESASTKYYKEFWARRKSENNDSVVFNILKDIKLSYQTMMTSSIMQLSADESKVNDTLYQLLKIEYRSDSLTKELALKDFETLRQFGFHQSAYNLLFEVYRYSDINWNRDSLVGTLKNSNEYVYPWFEDDTK